MHIRLFVTGFDTFHCFLIAALIGLPSCAIAEEWIYTVRPGDNLWNLTERHLTDMRYISRLQQLNNIKNPYVIPPGTQLRIPLSWTRLVGNTQAKIVSVHGTAVVHRANQAIIPAVSGMQLMSGDLIQSENDSFVTIEFSDNSQLRIQENSQVRLKEMRIFGDHGLVDTLIYLEQGRTENSVRKDSSKGTRFRIQTPSAISSVRGTAFRVGIDASQSSTSSEVLTGNIDVSGEKRKVKVPTGFGTVTAIGAPPAQPVTLLPPPDLSDTHRYYESLPLAIHLAPLAGAKAYRTQIALDKAFDHLLSEFTTATLPFRDGDIPDGDYWLRIRGIDESGIEGKDAVIAFSLNARPAPPFVSAPLPDGVTTPENQKFNWTTQSEATHYTLMISRNTDFTDLVYFNPEIKENNLSLPESLAPGHYFWRIASVSPSEGMGPFSDTMPFRVPYPGPSLDETQLDEKEMTFAWRSVAEGQSFNFQFSRDKTFTDIIVDEITPASRMSIEKPPGGTYYLRIKTIESDGFEGPWGPLQTIEIPRDIPYWLMLLLLLPLLVLI
ncbi:MAG: FecR domain-containing protein [Burkholderiales bacterium]|nr:FecR domain-containing protein [Burkholderiales bacterium]MDR4518095.1 FecR domain-containing protein [Nitrosomonas sp.]